ncbi:MAG: hypothetical protein JXB50_01290 [Spirochaetes bacterium]|nr:hypothetical protein [Spirochaetota bacterium]
MIKKMMILLLPVLFFSCYTQKIILNPDKNSGELFIEYNLTDDTFQLLSFAFYEMADDQNKLSPEALIDVNLFKEKFKESENVKLKSVKIDNTNGYKGAINIEFKNLEKAMLEIPKEFINFTMARSGNFLQLSQTVNFKEMDKEGKFKQFIIDQKTDDIQFYNYLVNDTKFNFILETRTPIFQASGVRLSNFNKKAEYTFKLGDYINNENKILKFFIKL